MRRCSERSLLCEVLSQPSPFNIARRLFRTMLMFQRDRECVFNPRGCDNCCSVTISSPPTRFHVFDWSQISSVGAISCEQRVVDSSSLFLTLRLGSDLGRRYEVCRRYHRKKCILCSTSTGPVHDALTVESYH